MSSVVFLENVLENQKHYQLIFNLKDKILKKSYYNSKKNQKRNKTKE